MSVLNWDTMPRLLSELCEGHPGYSTAVYRLDYPTGGSAWLCTACYVRQWESVGRPTPPVERP